MQLLTLSNPHIFTGPAQFLRTMAWNSLLGKWREGECADDTGFEDFTGYHLLLRSILEIQVVDEYMIYSGFPLGSCSDLLGESQCKMTRQPAEHLEMTFTPYSRVHL